MADWVACTAVGGDEEKTILVNLDAAYLISPTNLGSQISFIVSEHGGSGGIAVSHSVKDTPEEIVKKLKVRPNI